MTKVTISIESEWVSEWVSEIGCLTSHATIFQLYMWRHIDVQADWRNNWTYGRAPCAKDISYHGSLSKHRYGPPFLAHLSRRLEWAIVIAHRPSSVRPSVRLSVCLSVRPSVNFSHFRLLLQNHLMDFDETWYGWSTHGPLQVFLFFGQIRPGADPGRGKNRSQEVPFFNKLFLQTGRLQQQTECIAMM